MMYGGMGRHEVRRRIRGVVGMAFVMVRRRHDGMRHGRM